MVVKTILNPSPPDFVGRRFAVGSKIFQRLVGDTRGFVVRHLAKNFGGKDGVRGGIARALAGLGGESRTLCKLWAK